MKKFFQLLLMIALLSLAAFCVYKVRSVLGAFVTAVVFAYLADKPVQSLERRMRKNAAIAVVFCVAGLSVGVFLWLVLPLITRQIGELATILPALMEKMHSLLEGLREFLPMLGAEDIQGRITQWVTGLAVQMAQRSYDMVGWVFIVPILSYYLLRDKALFIRSAEYLVPMAWREGIVGLWRNIDRSLGQFIRGQMLVTVVVGVFTGLGLALARVPYAALLGAVMAVFNLVPYIGPFLGALPIAVIAVFSGWKTLLLALLVVVAVQQVESVFISPRIIGGSISMHPVYVLVGVLCGGALMGPAGFIMAIPALVIIKETTQYLINKRMQKPARASCD